MTDLEKEIERVLDKHRIIGPDIKRRMFICDIAALLEGRGKPSNPHRTCGVLDHPMGCECDKKQHPQQEPSREHLWEIINEQTKIVHARCNEKPDRDESCTLARKLIAWATAGKRKQTVTREQLRAVLKAHGEWLIPDAEDAVLALLDGPQEKPVPIWCKPECPNPWKWGTTNWVRGGWQAGDEKFCQYCGAPRPATEEAT